MAEFVAFEAKSFSYLIDYGDKKQQAKKVYVIKQKYKFEDYKNCP